MPARPPIRSARRRRRAYTLPELLVAMASATVLMGGLASSLYLAGRALDPGGAALDTADAAGVLNRLRDDLRHARGFSQLDARSATFTVPDRDGDLAAETLRYAWSGVAGSPLIYEYNGQAQTLLTDVRRFDLTWFTRSFVAPAVDPGGEPRKLLFVVTDADNPSADEAAHQALFAGWGYAVTPISESANSSTFAECSVDAAVAVISGECTDGDYVGGQLAGVPGGVVSELPGAGSELGFATNGVFASADGFEIAAATHGVTAGFDPGPLTVLSTPRPMICLFEPIAAGAERLATITVGLNNYPCLAAIEVGGGLHPVGSAAGRRVMLPFGSNDFGLADLTPEGETLLRQAVDWAAELGNPEVGVQYLGFAEAAASQNTSALDVPVPTVGTAGDLLIAAVVTDGSTAGSLAPEAAGWNPIAVGTSSGVVTTGVWWRTAGASEPADYRFGHTGNQEMYGWVMRFRGHHPTAPIDAVQTQTGLSVDPTSPAVTTSVDNALVLRIGGFDDDSVMIDDPAMPGHSTITMDESGPGGGTCSGGAAYVVQPTAGDSGATDFLLNTFEFYFNVTLAIAPEEP